MANCEHRLKKFQCNFIVSLVTAIYIAIVKGQQCDFNEHFWSPCNFILMQFCLIHASTCAGDAGGEGISEIENLVFALSFLLSRGVKMCNLGTGRWLQKLGCVAEAICMERWL